ncbi:MAG: 23S rRNA (pseudouridine(1915)-N(3))-methyltransferase RlmH [Limnobacter sp.]|nr:23S rRNA (pseudouridine(1915)-N(3))-methyltransferase RlmH [Limnobacter sp.]
MKITLIALSHKLEPWASQGAAQFIKRLPPDWKLDIKELKPEDRASGKPTPVLLASEAGRIRAAIPKGAQLVGLDERGTSLTSHQLASTLGKWHDLGMHLCLLIGSADGLDPTLKQECQALWKLSDLTLPHALARVLATEALYRAWSILAGHPYHRD